MGWNTTIVVMNDALTDIQKDSDFGRTLVRAILTHQREPRLGDVRSGGHLNAATVIESHHADATALITVGGNMGVEHLTLHGWNHHEPPMQLVLCRAWAERLGYRLTKIPQVTKPG